MKHRIIYTRHDGGVTICCPSENCIRWMSSGGRWADYPHGFVDEQIERQIATGHDQRAVVKFCRALAFGGCTEAEALEIIRDRDCGHKGTAVELVDVSEVSSDRWFRNAWRRSHNGGPIGIDMKTAKRIQYQRIQKISQKFHLKLPLWRNRVARAQTPDELKAVWPSIATP